MAPSFDNLPVDEDYDDEEIDFSDLQEQYAVRLEEGLDTFVVIDGLPLVNEEQKPKLVKFVLKKISAVARAREDSFYMPLGDNGMSEGYVKMGWIGSDVC